jgi:hypothetical protein
MIFMPISRGRRSKVQGMGEAFCHAGDISSTADTMVGKDVTVHQGPVQFVHPARSRDFISPLS